VRVPADVIPAAGQLRDKVARSNRGGTKVRLSQPEGERCSAIVAAVTIAAVVAVVADLTISINRWRSE
jgi:hypothetical protein